SRCGEGGGKPSNFGLPGGALERKLHGRGREGGGDRVPDSLLVIRIGEAVKEPDRYRLYFLGRQCLDRALDAVFVEILEYLALRVNTLSDRQTPAARNKWERQIDVDVILFESIFVADFDHVAEALRGKKRCFGALAFDQRVRC